MALIVVGCRMCDGFSEAFLAAAAGASEGVGAMAGGYTALAGAGEAVGSAASMLAANAGTLAAAGSAAMAGYSAYTQANAGRQVANYQAQVAGNNAVLAGYQRSAAIQQGDLQVQHAMLQQSQLYGEQRATLAANGLDMSSGSAVDQLATTRFLGQQDVNNLQSNAARAAWGYAGNQANYRAEAQLSRWQAANNDPAGIGVMSGAGSLLSGARLYGGRA